MSANDHQQHHFSFFYKNPFQPGTDTSPIKHRPLFYSNKIRTTKRPKKISTSFDQQRSRNNKTQIKNSQHLLIPETRNYGGNLPFIISKKLIPEKRNPVDQINKLLMQVRYQAKVSRSRSPQKFKSSLGARQNSKNANVKGNYNLNQVIVRQRTKSENSIDKAKQRISSSISQYKNQTADDKNNINNTKNSKRSKQKHSRSLEHTKINKNQNQRRKSVKKKVKRLGNLERYRIKYSLSTGGNHVNDDGGKEMVTGYAARAGGSLKKRNYKLKLMLPNNPERDAFFGGFCTWQKGCNVDDDPLNYDLEDENENNYQNDLHSEKT